jgi:UDP-galactopyranose mutase
MKADLVVVGSGFYGLTIARQAVEELNLRVLIIEKREHIGGNAYSYFDDDLGIEIHKYGSHLFHTSNERIWEYVNRFTKFNSYVHRVYSVHKEQIYSMPINLSTISQFYGRSLTPDEAKNLIQNASSESGMGAQENLESKAISLIGRPLYEAFIMGYTQKQWETDPKNLSADIINRLPVRYNFDNRYFSDKYEGLPIDGYKAWIERMADHPNIEIEMNSDFLKRKSQFVGNVPVVYTGAIDSYFECAHGELNWRTLDFETVKLEIDDFQGTSVVNFADLNVPYTRIHEYKHLHPERTYANSGTIIAKEYSRMATSLDEPYYPVNLEKDREILSVYKNLSKAENAVWFGGRLGSYKYLDMHMAIGSALTLFDKKIYPFFKSAH